MHTKSRVAAFVGLHNGAAHSPELEMRFIPTPGRSVERRPGAGTIQLNLANFWSRRAKAKVSSGQRKSEREMFSSSGQNFWRHSFVRLCLLSNLVDLWRDEREEEEEKERETNSLALAS